MPSIRLLVLGGLLLAPAALGAEANALVDTARYEVPEVVVTALRGRDRLRDIPAASFVFSRDRIQQSGVTRVTSLLQALPGLYGYLQNSSGDAQVVDPRGFTANGESSYLKVLVDGQDVRDVENGNVNWDWLLPHDVERIEVVEGPGAWLYGDGSEGGIVNIVRPPVPSGLHSDCGAQFGSFGHGSGSIVVSGASGVLAGSLRGSARRVLGWRDHSRERTFAGGAEGVWNATEHTRVTVNANYLDAFRQDPGALTPEQLAADREQADTGSDTSHPRRLLVGAMVTSGRPGESEWRVMPYVRTEDAEQVRTILQPKIHPTEGLTLGTELGWQGSPAGKSMRLFATAQAEHAQLDSRYYDFADGARGAPRSDGESERATFSGFLGTTLDLGWRTSARLGIRQDAVRVKSTYTLPDTAFPTRTFHLTSPFMAVSRQVGEGAMVYASYSAAFRVPTLNQLYDFRPIDTPFGTFSLSSPGLVPQKSHGIELGGRWDGSAGAHASLGLYTIRVRNEIDFDGATNLYANLHRSWHRGVQGMVQHPILGRVLTGQGALLASAAFTYSPTTIRGGEFDGKQINAVPRRTAYGSLRWVGSEAWSLEGGVRYVGPQFLDKANEHPLAEFTTVEMTGSLRWARLRGTVRVANLLDRHYSDTGYIGLFGEERLYPAPGRSFVVSVTAD